MTNFSARMGILLALVGILLVTTAGVIGQALPSDGEIRYIGREPYGFYALDVDHGVSLRLARLTPDLVTNFYFQWSPDGRFASAQLITTGEQMVLSTETGDTQWLGVVSPSWFSDGAGTYFHARMAWDTPSRVYVANAAGSAWRALTPDDGVNYFEPEAAPDDRTIAFLSSESNLYSMRTDGSALKLLFDADATLHFPRWSPDGRQLSVVQRTTTGSNIYLMNADGSSLRLLVSLTSYIYFCEWSPQGGDLLILSGNGEYRLQVNIIDSVTSEIRTALRSVSTFSSMPNWSPDGRYIYATGVLEGAQNDRDTFIYAANAQQNSQIVEQSFIEWSPDGQRIAYVDAANANHEQICIRYVEDAAPSRCLSVVRGASSLRWLP